jgi:hypothetical protein
MHHNDRNIFQGLKLCSLKLFNQISYEEVMNLQMCKIHNFEILAIVMYVSSSIT